MHMRMAMEPEREVALASDEELLFAESAEDGSSAYEGDVSLMCSAGSEVEGGGEGSEQGGLRLLLESEFGEEPRDESTDRESEERSITPRASAWLQSTDGFTLSAGASSAPLDRVTPKHDSVSAEGRPSTDAPSVGVRRDWATDRGRHFGTDPRREAELIGARSKVAQLEVEVDSLRRAAKRARMEEEDSRDHSRRELCGKMESLHRLEQERCDMVEKLTGLETMVTTLKKRLSEKQRELEEVSVMKEEVTETLQQQLLETSSSARSLKSENEHLLNRLALQEQQVELGATGLEEMREAYESSLDVLRERVQQLEGVERRLQSQEAKAIELERRLGEHKHDSHFVSMVKSRVVNWEEMERQNRLLSEENKTLREKSGNIDLLRYRSQTLEERVRGYEQQEAALAELHRENKTLREHQVGEGGGGVSVATPTLQQQLAHLQRREVVLSSRSGDLETLVKLAEKEAVSLREALEESRQRLTKEQSDGRSRDLKMQRLEKRLLFVTKERDGCVNVLASYKLDGGVDAILKTNLTEVQLQLTTAQSRILELENELETAAERDTPPAVGARGAEGRRGGW